MKKQELQDFQEFLFNKKLPENSYGTQENFFRLLHLSNDNEAITINYSLSPGAWERSGRGTTFGNEYIQEIINESQFKNLKCKFNQVFYKTWHFPWDLTSKESINNFPLLILIEKDNDSVDGVLMRNTHNQQIEKNIAEKYFEKSDVLNLIDELKDLPKNENFLSIYKDKNISANSLEETYPIIDYSEGQQAQILIYQNNEWLFGTVEKDNAQYVNGNFFKVSDFYGLPASKQIINMREDIDSVVVNQTIPGDEEVIYKAIHQLNAINQIPGITPEDFPPFKTIWQWWNDNAPKNMKDARLFHIYIWNPENRLFIAGNDFEPANKPENISKIPTYSLFTLKNKLTVVIAFFKGEEHFKQIGNSVQTFYADGSEAWEIGGSINELNETYYCLSGLQKIADKIEEIQ